MTRPKKCRRVGCEPRANYFKPRGIPLIMLKEVKLSIDELESIRLADLEGLEQAKAALRMKISRPTFGRIVESARRIIADAVVNGKALKIEGGEIIMKAKREFSCNAVRQTAQIAIARISAGQSQIVVTHSVAEPGEVTAVKLTQKKSKI